jgi:hypothetical protein
VPEEFEETSERTSKEQLGREVLMAEKKKPSHNVFEFVLVMVMAIIAIVSDKIGGKNNRGGMFGDYETAEAIEGQTVSGIKRRKKKS